MNFYDADGGFWSPPGVAEDVASKEVPVWDLLYPQSPEPSPEPPPRIRPSSIWSLTHLWRGTHGK